MDNMDSYKILYKNSHRPYGPVPSWVANKEFTPDKICNRPLVFIPDLLLTKVVASAKFVPTPLVN
jgi:hypothetical protein